ncbi:MAG: PAS domain-containing protein [Bosea sp. (in: a-proteobacteria)]
MKNTSSHIVFEYWDRLRGERAAPERGEIEPGEIREALADAFVLETVNHVPVFRLAGTRIAALFGRELKTAPFTSISEDQRAADELGRLMDSVQSETAGAVAGLIAETAEGDKLHLELLLLPLRHRGKTHARVMGALSAATTPSWYGLRPVRKLQIISVRMIWPRSRLRSLAAAAARRAGFVLVQGGRN